MITDETYRRIRVGYFFRSIASIFLIIMTNNIELIKPLLNFTSDDDYYFLQVLVRKKDRDILPFKIGGSNNNSRLIRPYYIRSVEYLENHMEEIKALCDLFQARAMICLNKRSFYSSSHQMLVRLAQSIQSKNYNNSKMWNNVSVVLLLKMNISMVFFLKMVFGLTQKLKIVLFGMNQKKKIVMFYM